MSTEFELRCPISADLGSIRDRVRLHALHTRLSAERVEELVLAVNEAVTNVLDHGGRAGHVVARRHGDGVIVEILDVGGRLTAGHLAAARLDLTGRRGFGLWMIQRLCDEVRLEETALGPLLRLRVRDRPRTDRPAGPFASARQDHPAGPVAPVRPAGLGVRARPADVSGGRVGSARGR